jgi:hypothetical protein
MTMQASTLGILEAADFSPKQARALAQAIEGEIRGSDLVTVPIFEAGNGGLKLQMAQLNGELRLELAGIDRELRLELARFERNLKVELSQLESRLFNKTAALGLTAAGMVISAVYFLVLNLRR